MWQACRAVAEVLGWLFAIVFVLGAFDFLEFVVKVSARADAAAHSKCSNEGGNMDNQHRKIRGYRELTAEEIDLMNRIKAKGTELLQLQAELAGRLSTDHECKRAAARAGATVQPVTLRFVNADGSISQAASYVGDTTLLQSIWRLASARGQVVELHYGQPLSGQQRTRFELCAHAEQEIAAGLQPGERAPLRAAEAATVEA